MKKKKQKYRKWIDDFPSSPLTKTGTDDSEIIPYQLILKSTESGIFFGIRDGENNAKYIGIPQGTEGNILIVGGNGSGKSSGIAKPTLQTWNGGLCVTDIKGELSDHYQNLYLNGQVKRPYIIFNPIDVNTPSYDPFSWLLKDSNANLVKNIWEIAIAIIPLPPDEKQPFWIQTEQAVFAAALLHYFNLGLSFSETISKIISLPLSSLCIEIKEANNIFSNSFLGEITHMKAEVLADVDRGLRNKLMLFANDPYISHVFRGTQENARCFTWDDLDKCNIFLRIPADRIEQWSGAINLMYTQLIRHLERKPDKYSIDGSHNVPILLLMDEFARFSKLEMITSAMSTLRSKSVNICLIIQSIAQLDKIYGEYDRRIIFDNCQYQAILRANDSETQKYLSELIGTTMGIQRSISETRDNHFDTMGYSKNITEIRKLKVFPHELSTLKDILLLTPYGFCYVKKLNVQNQLCLSNGYKNCLEVSGVQSTADSETASKNTLILQAISYSQSPIPCPNNLFMNESAKMLTMEERTTNANNKAIKAKQQLRQKQRQEREIQAKKTQRRNYIIGELFSEYFPIVQTIEPGTNDENEINFEPLKTFLSLLADNQYWKEKLIKMISDP